VVWLIVLGLVVLVAIWLAIAVFKWLFILAIVAALVWLVFFRGRERT
jgi:hypothetical protein